MDADLPVPIPPIQRRFVSLDLFGQVESYV